MTEQNSAPLKAPRVAEPASNQFALLGTRRFLPLFLVQFLGALNDQIYQKAFIALVTYRLADQQGLDVGLLGTIASIVFILPFALIAPSAGQLADRRDKAMLMRWIKASEVVVMSMAVVAYHLQNIYLLYFVLFLMGSQSAMFAPIKYSVLPQYLHRDELMGGNGLVQGFTFLAIIFGTIIGNELILTERGVLIVSITVVSVAAVGFVASLYAPPAAPVTTEGHADWNLARAIVTLLRQCTGNRPAMRAIYGISWFWFLGAMFLALLPAYAKNELGVNEGVLTVLLAGFSIGVAVGAISSEAVNRGRVGVQVPPVAALGLAVMAIELWFATPPAPATGTALMDRAAFFDSAAGWRILIDFIILAAFAGAYVTPMNAVLQVRAPDERRASFVACSNVIDSAAIVANGILVMILRLIGVEVRVILVTVTLSAIPVAFLIARDAPDTRLGRLALSIWPKR